MASVRDTVVSEYKVGLSLYFHIKFGRFENGSPAFLWHTYIPVKQDLLGRIQFFFLKGASLLPRIVFHIWCLSSSRHISQAGTQCAPSFQGQNLLILLWLAMPDFLRQLPGFWKSLLYCMCFILCGPRHLSTNSPWQQRYWCQASPCVIPRN